MNCSAPVCTWSRLITCYQWKCQTHYLWQMVLYFAIVPPMLRGIWYAFFGRKTANRLRILDWPRSAWWNIPLINQFFVTSIFPYEIMKTWFLPFYPNHLFCLISHFIFMFDFLYLICCSCGLKYYSKRDIIWK